MITNYQKWDNVHYPGMGSLPLALSLQFYEKRIAHQQKTVASPLLMLGNLKMRHSLERRDCGERVCCPQALSVLYSSRWTSLPEGEHNKLLPQLWCCLGTQFLSLLASLLSNQVEKETSKETLMELSLPFYMP